MDLDDLMVFWFTEGCSIPMPISHETYSLQSLISELLGLVFVAIRHLGTCDLVAPNTVAEPCTTADH